MDQNQLERLVRDVLGDTYLTLTISRYELVEDLERQRASLQGVLRRSDVAEEVSLKGEGVGLVDALFQALTATLAHTFPSLRRVRFVEFTFSGEFNEAMASQSDAHGRVSLRVENSAGRRFEFSHSSSSITASSMGAVLRAVAHFVNAELAVLRVCDWIDDARRRHRADLVDTYTRRLADLMSNASYSEVIERRKARI
jgi:hypothetical protein